MEGLPSNGLVSAAQLASCSPACNQACKAVLSAVFLVRNIENDLVGINLTNELYKPLGRLVVGNICTHIKRQKISREGGRMLMRDLEEYSNALNSIEENDINDLMNCMKEISIIYLTPADRLVKVRSHSSNICITVGHSMHIRL
jgi:hypothetical protein